MPVSVALLRRLAHLYLAAQHGLQVIKRFIRTEISDKEVNLFATAKRQNGEEVVIVGESVLKLDDRSKLRQVQEAIEAAAQTTDQPIIPLIVTHYCQTLGA